MQKCERAPTVHRHQARSSKQLLHLGAVDGKTDGAERFFHARPGLPLGILEHTEQGLCQPRTNFTSVYGRLLRGGALHTISEYYIWPVSCCHNKRQHTENESLLHWLPCTVREYHRRRKSKYSFLIRNCLPVLVYEFPASRISLQWPSAGVARAEKSLKYSNQTLL